MSPRSSDTARSPWQPPRSARRRQKTGTEDRGRGRDGGHKVVFRRRDRRTPLQAASDFLYPKGGWTRAFLYVKHRIRRLPDSPERIARGIWAGVFTTFTPFYTIHFLVAFLVARLMRGNILAALSATFFGNPLTYVPIGMISLKTGHYLLGTKFEEGEHRSFVGKFADAGHDLKNNLFALFSDAEADWQGLSVFFDEIFYPYLVGGLIPGALAGTIPHVLSVRLLH